MKTLLAFSILTLLALNARSAPPFYSVTTNYVTNVFPIAQLNSNAIGGVITNVVLMTNIVGVPELHAKPIVEETIQKVGASATESGYPLVAIAGNLLLAILAAFAGWKNQRAKKLAEVLAQGFETSREVIKNQPDGHALESALVREVKAQQVEAGVKEEAAKVSANKVNPVEAKEAADRVAKPAVI